MPFLKQIHSTYLSYNPTLYCSHHIFNKRTQYRKNNGLKCLRSGINTKVEFLNKDIVETFSNSECYDQDSPRSQRLH